jgi:hypothetical protein
LFSLVSPAWIKPGNEASIRNAPTEMGRVSGTLSFTADGANLIVQPRFVRPPRYVVFRIPYTVELVGFTSDASRAFQKDGALFFTSDVTTASFKWRHKTGAHDGNYQGILKSYRGEFSFVVADDKYDPRRASIPFLLEEETSHPPEPLSFDLVRRAFHQEYSRRFTEYMAAGGAPYLIKAPALLTAAERMALFKN